MPALHILGHVPITLLERGLEKWAAAFVDHGMWDLEDGGWPQTNVYCNASLLLSVSSWKIQPSIIYI